MKTLIVILVLTMTSKIGTGPLLAQPHVAEQSKIQAMIDQLVSVPDSDQIAGSILKASTKYQIEPEVLVALFMVESSFNQNAISSTGDIGIGQINPLWKNEFRTRHLGMLDLNRLRQDRDYNIQITAQILSLCKKGGYKNYYGVFHSKTPSERKIYTLRVQSKLSEIKLAVAKN